MTGRRQAYFERWAPAHNLTVEEAIKKFPEQAGITRFGKPEEIAARRNCLAGSAATASRARGSSSKGLAFGPVARLPRSPALAKRSEGCCSCSDSCNRWLRF